MSHGRSARSLRWTLAIVPLACEIVWSIDNTAPQPDSGRIYLYNKEYSRAAGYYKQALDNGGDTSYLHRNFQDACFALGDSVQEDLAEQYARLAERNRENPLYHYLYGRCLPCSSAMRHFDRALELDSCYTWAFNARGACYFERGDYENAKEQFLQAIQCNPDFPEAYNNLVTVYVKTGQDRRAQKVFRKLIARDRRNGMAYEWLGDFYLGREEYEFARQAYMRAAACGARGPGIFFKAGYACFQIGRYNEAAVFYRQSIENGNRTYDICFNLASTYEQLGYWEEAINTYEDAYNVDHDYRVLYSIGNCAVMLGLHTKAIESYGAFLEKEPRNTEAIFGLANAYQIRKDFDKAIRYYLKVLEIDPDFSKAYYNLGSIYAYHVKNIGKMKLYWGQFVSLFPQHEDAAFIQKEMRKLINDH